MANDLSIETARSDFLGNPIKKISRHDKLFTGHEHGVLKVTVRIKSKISPDLFVQKKKKL